MKIGANKRLALLCALLWVSACEGSGQSTQTVYSKQGVAVDVFEVGDASQLRLYLNRADGKPYQSFAAIRAHLPACERMLFGMNAGMYHADYQPVGLYVEQGRRLTALNQSRGLGNFFMQPNGVLAWSGTQMVVMTTAEFAKQNNEPMYATQSGPMLVVDGNINPQFSPESKSLNVRNGVGVLGQTAYFAISRTPISLYDFAQVFQQQLQVPQALYLDGSISSVYAPALGRDDTKHLLGPMLVQVDNRACSQ